MELPKYARLEHERRWLVGPGPVELVNPRPFSRRFLDRYLDCGRLRLRAIEDPDGLARRYKLTKKYPVDCLDAQPIVSVFLSREEYETMRSLSGRDLVKTRRYDEVGGWLFSIDTFDRPHAGLVLCEVEADSAEALARVVPPHYVLREVTHELAYTGGSLARIAAERGGIAASR